MATGVLVVGGAGYIGSHACKALAAAGYVPVTLDNLSTGHRWAVQWGPLVHGGCGDESLVRRTLRKHAVEAVLHFAGLSYVDESMRLPGKYFQNNVADTIGLLNAMQSEGLRRIVFSSTCATYGAPRTAPIDEDHPQVPVNPYGESKRFVERMLHWYGEAHALRYMALRYFNAAGADRDGDIGEAHQPETHLVPRAIEAAQGRRKHVEILGADYATPDGTAIRDYVHVSDLAEAHVRALQRLLDGGPSAQLNLGSGIGYSVREVIRAVEQVGNCTVPVREAPRRPGDPPSLVADGVRARAVLDWAPRYSDLHTIVSTAWRWHEQRNERERMSASGE